MNELALEIANGQQTSSMAETDHLKMATLHMSVHMPVI